MPDGSTTHQMAYYMEYSTRIYQVYLKYCPGRYCGLLHRRGVQYPIAYLHEKGDKTRTVPFLQEQFNIVSGICVHFIRMNQPTAKSRCFIPLFMGCSNKYLRIRLRCFLRSMVRWLTIPALKSLLTSMRICSDIREQCTYTIKGCQ